MKTIGLLGGMSWESSIEYYRIINQSVKRQLGGSHSAQCLMYSVDFAEIEALQHAGKWDQLTDRMVEAAQRLVRGGADCIVICTNTMHLMAEEIQAATKLPLLHIVDVTAAAIKDQGLETVGLLGTRFTMERDFYRGRLENNHNIKVLIPEDAQRAEVHRIIYEELIHGEIHEESRKVYQEVIKSLQNRGAQGVVLGCTEIPLLIRQGDVGIPVFDTTVIHAEAAVRWALEGI